ncbi:MAG: hypothetical protein U0228_14355 [Myxococcaceae bacterium]
MSRGAKRFSQFAGLVLGLLLALELVCRAGADGLAAVAHRVHFKLALLRAHGPVDFVSLGSSRSNDGIAPGQLGLGSGFAASTPSTSLPTLEYFAAHLGAQKLVLVEVSRPTFAPTPMDDVAPPANPEAFQKDPVGEWLSTHSALLQRRRAFALENLPRVFALAFASRFDGSEWFRSRQLVETFRDEAPPPDVHDDEAWKPAAADASALVLDDDAQRVLAGYERVVASLRASGAKVVLTAPPLGLGWRAEECGPAQNALRAEVARRTQAPLLDFTCAEVSEAWFLEGQHLSSPGRARYSKALGDALRALP